MPAGAETPSVTLSFANNFWGKDDAGVSPLLERMHNAKTTCDEVKAFYSARAAIEDEYARKLQALARKPLGAGESGTLRMSLDTVKRELETIAKAHQSVATQMKMELDEQLGVNAGGLKERRKVIQTGIEKLYKIKQQQTATLNKARDRYEQDCLKVKGYTAQGHMVMGQEERKNKAKLEKTYAQMATTSGDYQQAVTALQETTGRWNREWKNACDKFQDLEEERIDYLKSSLWNFANISSTVCVTDDQACENIRLSLEKCDVQEDVISFIKVHGTGQDIPDPPKFIDFCRDDASDVASEAAETRPAQFPRVINPAIRAGAVSPQPSILESHHDPNSALAHEMGIGSSPGHTDPGAEEAESHLSKRQPVPGSGPYGQPGFSNTWADVNKPPANQYRDGMNGYSRAEPPPLNASEMSASSVSNIRSASRDSHSEVSQSSFTSYEPSSGAQSPVKQMINDPSGKKPWYRNSPFNRSKESNESTPTPVARPAPASRNTWGPVAAQKGGLDNAPGRLFGRGSILQSQKSMSPEPLDHGVKTQLNIGTNVFDVSPDGYRKKQGSQVAEPPPLGDPSDPLEQALADLADITKFDSNDRGYGTRGWPPTKTPKERDSADHHMGIYTPSPGTPNPAPAPITGGVPTPFANTGTRGTPPPAYNVSPVNHLGAPPAAHTAKEMHAAKNRYVNQRGRVFEGQSNGAPPQVGGHSRAPSRAASPGPVRAVSPRPGPQPQGYTRAPSSQCYQRAASPNPYGGNRPRANTATPQKGAYAGNGGSWGSRTGSPGMMNGGPMPRAISPQPGAYHGASQSRPGSRMAGGSADMAVQVHGAGNDYGSVRGRGRPTSQHYGSSDGAGGQVSTRVRSKSVAEPRQYTKDGRAILHHARAMYMYQAQIPEELGFSKGDVLAVLRLQDDGWWEAEIAGRSGERGLVPSNYLQTC